MDTTAVRASVYQVLDRVRSEKSVNPGIRGSIYAVVDALRSSAAAAEELRHAESISIAIHRLESIASGQASCTATSVSPELTQAVQQQISAGGDVQGGDQTMNFL